MLNFKITPENPRMVDDYKAKLLKAFPGKNPDDMYDVLNSYDSAYLSSREYFAYYFVMTTKTIVEYINSNGLGRIWQFLTDAILDEGVISLYSMVDERSNRYRNVLRRSKGIFGFSISEYAQSKEYIKKIRIYRNQRAAHFGDDYFEENSSIRYDDVITMLEHLRRDRVDFNEKYLGLEDLAYDNLETCFSEKIPTIISMLNAELNMKKIKVELSEYLNSVIADNFKS